MTTQTLKRCSCCGHDHDAESWGSLEYLGIMDPEDGEPAIEMRNCTCGSTLAIELPGTGAAK